MFDKCPRCNLKFTKIEEDKFNIIFRCDIECRLYILILKDCASINIAIKKSDEITDNVFTINGEYLTFRFGDLNMPIEMNSYFDFSDMPTVIKKINLLKVFQ